MGSSAPGGGNEFHVLRYENKAPGELFARCARWAPRLVGQVASPGERQVGSKWPDKILFDYFYELPNRNI